MRRAVIAALPVLLGLAVSHAGCGDDWESIGHAGAAGRAGSGGKAGTSAAAGTASVGGAGTTGGNAGSRPIGGAPNHGKLPAWAVDESVWTTIPNPAPAPNCTFSETLLPEGDETRWEWNDLGQGVGRATLFAPTYYPAASTHRRGSVSMPVLWGATFARFSNETVKVVSHHRVDLGDVLGAVRSIESPNPTKYTQCAHGLPQGETAMVNAFNGTKDDVTAFVLMSILRLDGSRFDRYFLTNDGPAGASMDVEVDGIARYVFSGLGVVGWLPEVGSPKPEYILGNASESLGVGEGELAVFLRNQNTRREVRAWDVKGKEIVTLWEQPKNGYRLAISPTSIVGVMADVGDGSYGVDLQIWEMPRTATPAEAKPRVGPVVRSGAKATFMRTWGDWAGFWLADGFEVTGDSEIVLVHLPTWTRYRVNQPPGEEFSHNGFTLTETHLFATTNVEGHANEEQLAQWVMRYELASIDAWATKL